MEINIECPQALTEEISKVLIDCMRSAGNIFCKKVLLDADASIGSHWIH